jgi:hypothetical protein
MFELFNVQSFTYLIVLRSPSLCFLLFANLTLPISMNHSAIVSTDHTVHSRGPPITTIVITGATTFFSFHNTTTQPRVN